MIPCRQEKGDACLECEHLKRTEFDEEYCELMGDDPCPGRWTQSKTCPIDRWEKHGNS